VTKMLTPPSEADRSLSEQLVFFDGSGNWRHAGIRHLLDSSDFAPSVHRICSIRNTTSTKNGDRGVANAERM